MVSNLLRASTEGVVWSRPANIRVLELDRNAKNQQSPAQRCRVRLVPAFPFWAVKLSPALLGVRLSTYVFGTFVGIIPGTLAIASVGAGLDAVIVSAETEHATCIAANGPDSCTLAIHTGALMNTQLVVALVPWSRCFPRSCSKPNDRAEV